MEKIQADSVHVDPGVTFEGHATLNQHGGNPVAAAQAAYNRAARNVGSAGRKPVMVRVIVHVAPE